MKDGRVGRKNGVIRHNSGSCTFDGCTNTAHARGLCTGHWRQWHKGQELMPLRAHHRVVDGMKFCPDCGQSKPVSEFHARIKRKGVLQSQCKPCVGIRLRMATYALDRDAVVSMMARPCDVCGTKPEDVRQIHIDHCHDSGAVRGVLCNGCNTALGLARSDPTILRALADYVEWAAM
jgi:formate dehydrogenase maturation protein FdhE